MPNHFPKYQAIILSVPIIHKSTNQFYYFAQSYSSLLFLQPFKIDILFIETLDVFNRFLKQTTIIRNSNQMMPNHEQLHTTLARNFIKQNIIEFSNPTKVIHKQLVQRVLPQSLHPIKLLDANCPLIDFLKNNAIQDVQNFMLKYNEIQEFRLTKFGQYCGYVGKLYILFSENMIAFMRQDPTWKGFCYKVNKSVYIGQFINLKSSGDGMALFVEEQKELKKDPITLYHIFNGIWKDGEIQKGTRQTYTSYFKEREDSFGQPLLSYEGSFSNFQFDGEGCRKKGSREIRGKFEKGKYVRPQNIVEEEEKQSKQKQNNSSTNEKNIKSSRKFSANLEKQSSAKN